MFSSFLVAARYKTYVAVVMATLRALYADHPLPNEAPEAADAIAWAVIEAPKELPPELQGERLAATMAAYAKYETDVRKYPCVHRRDPNCADGGRAGGYWQLHQPAGFSDDARVQAVAWVELVRQSIRMCVTPERALAMTLSGHCNRGLVQTHTRLLGVELGINAWNASQDPAGSSPAPVSATTLTPAALRHADEAGDSEPSIHAARTPALF